MCTKYCFLFGAIFTVCTERFQRNSYDPFIVFKKSFKVPKYLITINFQNNTHTEMFASVYVCVFSDKRQNTL